MRTIILLLCILALCSASCSKKSKKVDEKTVSSKTVDLGESTPDESEQAGAPEADANAKAKRPDGDGQSATEEEKEWARKNDEAGKNPDGTSKRGKPAAELEFEEAQKANTQQAPASDSDGAESSGDSNALDFARDDTEAEQAQPAPQVPRPAKPKPPLEIEKYINIRELREQTGFAGVLAQDWLLGQNSDARYASARLATDNSAQLGFTVQVWRPGNEANASKRFNDLFRQSFGGQKMAGVATDAFIANHHKINELGFYEKNKRCAVLLSCSEEICTKEQLKSIALVIQRRL